ncbi:MMPL family transporter [Paenibacillus sp. YN15]|uniref:MMPL family transporter n=1 Tax=Paenibacillus sp. YN15 TaxID=1742774 RepID=UPI000DCEE2E4|nr:MMPL family transporter [Paenibacillus sp. YN15]RAV05093.1 MMPL family transporter [Paenibacillus sp. YN15]
MKKILTSRSISLLIWGAVTAVLLFTMPDMDVLVREKGQAGVPDTKQSRIANSMISKMNENGRENYDLIAVFYSGSGTALSGAQLEQVKMSIEELQSRSGELGIRQVNSYLDSDEMRQQLVSRDQSTILAQIAISKESGIISEVSERLEAVIQKDGLQTYLTGTDLVIEDFVKSTQEGIKKTEVIAVGFILAVLIIVFRSPVVPLVSLATVGVSYLVSMGIIAHLVDKFNYPFSNFTQVFLVVVLFGIGTDYNILLFTRYKEELGRQEHGNAAIKATYKSAGRTVLYSGLAVFIGFAALILAEFNIYRSSSSVAIGIAVLLLVLNTLNPFFMALLGKKLFWPSQSLAGHGDSRIWGALSRVSVRRPVAVLAAVALLCTPLIMGYSGRLSYNDLLEVDDAYASKQGISIIEEHFSPGFSSPATIVIEADHPLDTTESLQTVDELAEKISKVKGIEGVYTVTRPTGGKLKELYISGQSHELKDGLDEAGSGIASIHAGLASAQEEFKHSGANSLTHVQALIDGTGKLREGTAILGNALNQVAAGINSGAAGASELQSGLSTLQQQLGGMSQAAFRLAEGYAGLEAGLSSYSGYLDDISRRIGGASAGYRQIGASMTELVKSRPELNDDRNIRTVMDIAASGEKQLAELSAQLEQTIPPYEEAIASFQTANGALAQLQAGLGQVEQGAAQLGTGAAGLETGLKEGAAGSAQISGKTAELEAGLSQVYEGQKELLAGLGQLEGKMETLKAGLGESTAGLAAISEGLNDAREYLDGLSSSEASQKFYIPAQVLKSEEFQKSVDMYMSSDRKMVRMAVILEVNPYSAEAMDIAEDLNGQIKAALEGSGLSGAKVAVGGKSSQNVDLQAMAGEDFSRTVVLMLAGIGLMLVLVTRSFWQPVFIIGSLLLAYGASLGLGELIGTRLLGVDNLGWNVPFFTFIMIVALGVDYSIFLMMRFKERGNLSAPGIVEAARYMGGVVISAAVILSGTFAALIPSGVITLIEVAISIIIGLLLLSFIMLPVCMPALLSILYNGIGNIGKKKGHTDNNQ